MSAQIIAAISIAVCIVALYFAWKIYKDTRGIGKNVSEDDDMSRF